MRSRCRAQCSYRSTWPYMIVAVVLKPTPMRGAHHVEPVGRCRSCRGRAPRGPRRRGSRRRCRAACRGPASFSVDRNSRNRDTERCGALMHLERRERVDVHAGHRPGEPPHRSRGRSAPVKLGSMPPCMQTSVAPRSQASRARLRDLVERQRVRAGRAGSRSASLSRTRRTGT